MLQYRPGLRAARGGARPLSHTNTLGRGLGGQRTHRENPRDMLALLTSSLHVLCLVGVVVTGYYLLILRICTYYILTWTDTAQPGLFPTVFGLGMCSTMCLHNMRVLV